MAVAVYYHQCRCLHYAVTSCQLHVLLRIDGHVGHIFQIFLHQLTVRAGLGREQILDILRLLPFTSTSSAKLDSVTTLLVGRFKEEWSMSYSVLLAYSVTYHHSSSAPDDSNR